MDNLTERIQKRAYEVYLRHGQSGKDLENWIQAEKEIKAEEAKKTATKAPAFSSSKSSEGTQKAAARTSEIFDSKKPAAKNGKKR